MMADYTTCITRFDIVDVKIQALWWQKRGLSYTSSGYGNRIPTEYKIQLKGSKRWYRVYCCIFSNSGTLYINRGKVPKDKNYLMRNVVDGLDLSELLTERNI